MGGKSRIAKQLAAEINKIRRPGQLVWDAFCGGLSMSVELLKSGPVWATDANVPLITMYKAIQDGWEPPSVVSREDYERSKSLPDTDPVKAFCGFGCSFGGKWFGGYAHDSTGSRNRDGVPSNYALSAKRRLSKEVTRQSFSVIDFMAVDPFDVDACLYLDPPYAGATRYNGAAPFDHTAFCHRVAEWAARTHVFVSEYAFPMGECIWSKPQTTTVSRDKSKYTQAVERLYYIGPTSWGEALRRAESE